MGQSYFLCFILLGINFSPKNVEGLRAEKILNGYLAKPHRSRYVVAVIYKVENQSDVNPCTGSILTSWYITTVAHCFFNKTLGTYMSNQFFIVTSALNLLYPRHTSRYIQVDLVITPKYYNPTLVDTYNTRGNLAVVKLAETLGVINESHKFLKILKIPARQFKYTDKEFQVSGYGWHRFDPPSDDEIFPIGVTDGTLRFADAIVLTDDECQRAVGDKIAAGNMCARIVGNHPSVPMGICQGDSGGPLVYHSHIKGIAINGFLDCDESQMPGIYINTTYYREFIREAVSRSITAEMNVVKLTFIQGQYVFKPYRKRRLPMKENRPHKVPV